MRWQDIQDMLDRLDRRTSRSQPDTGAIAAVFLTGAAVGAAAGMLFAPHSGQETRARMAQKAKEGIHKSKDRAGKVKDAARENVSQATEIARRTFAEGKRATKEVRGHSSAEDEESQEA